MNSSGKFPSCKLLYVVCCAGNHFRDHETHVGTLIIRNSPETDLKLIVLS